MPKINPSQYDCDNMEVGDVVVVRKVNLLYRLIRKFFLKDKYKIVVRDGWDEPIEYKTYYQEDCTLIYAFEAECVQQYENTVPCIISRDLNSKYSRYTILDVLYIGLYNIQLKYDGNKTLTIPISYIDNAIQKNKNILKASDDKRRIKEAIKYQKFKGSYFEKYVKDNDIKEWVAVYCATCGKPVNFEFSEDNIHINNCCECGSLKFPLSDIDYDEFALWYTNQIVNPATLKVYNKFWFKRSTD